jgi:hypothetical protein
MSEGLEGLTRGGRGGSVGGYGNHAFGSVAGYVINPAGGQKGDPTDRIILDLQRPTLGFEASPAAPVRIEVAIAPPKPKDAGKSKARDPLGVTHVANGRGTAKPTKVGDFLMLKDIERQGDHFVARRVEVAVRGFKELNHFVYSGLFSIRPETEKKDNQTGEITYRQNRIGLLTDFADVVTSIDHLKERALQAFSDAANMHGSRAHFVLRGIQQNEQGKHHFSIAREIGLYDYDKGIEYDPKDAIKRFVDGLDGQSGPKILAYLGGAAMFEVIPQFRVNTGSASLPSAKRQAAEEKGPVSPADEWRFDEGVQQRFMEGDRQETGYSMMDVVLQRLESRDRPGEMTMTHSIFSQPQRPTQSLFALKEVVTPNILEKMPDLAIDLVKRADARSKAVREASKKAAQAPAQPEPEQEAGYAPAM